jgi:hypothetical protein
MNDWWNDPPEEEHKGVWSDAPDPAYDTLEEKEEAFCLPGPPAAKCPHGNEWGECDKCDFEGDIAFDAARERRFFGR